MNQNIEDTWKERNLLSLAAELGLIDLSDRINSQLVHLVVENETPVKSRASEKPYSQLT